MKENHEAAEENREIVVTIQYKGRQRIFRYAPNVWPKHHLQVSKRLIELIDQFVGYTSEDGNA